MAEFDANFTTFPDHPFIENTDNPNFVSSIFNKVKSITSAASNVVHNVLPLPNGDNLITSENASVAIASAQIGRSGRIYSPHSHLTLPIRPYPPTKARLGAQGGAASALAGALARSTNPGSPSGGNVKVKQPITQSSSQSYSNEPLLRTHEKFSSRSSSANSQKLRGNVSSEEREHNNNGLRINNVNNLYSKGLINGMTNDDKDRLIPEEAPPPNRSIKASPIVVQRPSTIPTEPEILGDTILTPSLNQHRSHTEPNQQIPLFLPHNPAAHASLPVTQLTSDAKISTGIVSGAYPDNIQTSGESGLSAKLRDVGGLGLNISSKASNTTLGGSSGSGGGGTTAGDLSIFSKDNSSVMDRENSSDAESIYSTAARRYFNSRVDRRPAPLKNGGLGKEYWMKDEHATECFGCTAKFTTFRRKHHCRVCGQIFCSKCTRLVDMDTLKHTPGKGEVPTKTKMRMCQTCYDNFLNLGSSDEEFEGDGVPIDYMDDTISEFGEQASIDQNISNMRHQIERPGNSGQILGLPGSAPGASSLNASENYFEIPKGSHRKHERFNKYMDQNTMQYSDEDEDYESSDSDSVIFHNNNNGNHIGIFSNSFSSQSNIHAPSSAGATMAGFNNSAIAKWEALGQSRSPSRSRNSFRKHRSGTSLSTDQPFNPLTPKSMRITPRKRSFTTRSKPSFSSSAIPSLSLNRPPSSSFGGNTSTSSVIHFNKASVAHAKAFLRQIFEHKEMPGKLGKWIDALMPPLLQCTSNINLDIKDFEVSDFRKFVKLKRISGGLPSHSQYIDGVVFSQSLPLKSMPQQLDNPAFLLAVNLFEHPRLHVSRIIDVSSQEIQRENTLIQRVLHLRPSVILTTGAASRSVLNKLDERGIAVLINVKRSVIDRVSSYTRAPIISYETLSYNTQLGHCTRFEVKTFRYQSEVKKYIFLSGIPKELGCTVVLRGADHQTLGIVKKIVELMVYILFNLKLETSLLREEYALIPDTPPLLKEIDKNKVKNTKAGRSNSEITNAPLHSAGSDSFSDAYSAALVEGKLLSTSPFVDYGLPYLFKAVRKSEDQLVAIDQEMDTRMDTVRQILNDVGLDIRHLPGGEETVTKMAQYLSESMAKKLYDTWSKQAKQWQNVFLRDPNMFTPEFHLQLVLLYTSVCTATATPCYGPELHTFRFYNDKQDMPLGHFIERLCLEANVPCSEGCGQTLKNHARTYAHGNGNLSITIKDHTCNFPGMTESILMWSTCKKCLISTPILPMSDDTWQYSLGKYFELSFWSSELTFQEKICPHNLYRDHVRFFGFKNMAVSIEYNEIVPYEVVLPSTQVEWVPERGMRLKASCYSQTVESVIRFYESVEMRLQSVKVDELAPEKIEQCRVKVEELLVRTEDEKREVIQDLDRIFVETSPADYLPLNGILRSMQVAAISWDHEFIEFANNFFPSEKDITRLTAAHLKKLFLSDDLFDKKQQLSEKPSIAKLVGKDDIHNEKEEAQKPKQTRLMEVENEKLETLEAEGDTTLIREKTGELSLYPNEAESGEATAINSSFAKLTEYHTIPNLASTNSHKAIEPTKDSKTAKISLSSAIEPILVCKESPQGTRDGKLTQVKDKPQEYESREIRDNDVNKIDTLKKAAEDIVHGINDLNDPPVTTDIRQVRSSNDIANSMNSLSHEPTPVNILQNSVPDLSANVSQLRTRSPSPGREFGRVQEAISRMEPSRTLQQNNIYGKALSAGPSSDSLSEATSTALFTKSNGSDLTSNESYNANGSNGVINKVQQIGASTGLTFKVRPSAIPVLKIPDRDILATSPDRMMEYAKLRLKYDPQGNSGQSFIPGRSKIEDASSSSGMNSQPSNKSSLSSNIKFQSKFDKIGYTPGIGFQNRFNAPLGSSWAGGGAGVFSRLDNSNNSVSGLSSISRVSSLAKHFEQLSKEFEKERARERRLLAQTQYRAVPVATSKPIVEVYQNVKDAVEELSQSEDEGEDGPSASESEEELQNPETNKRKSMSSVSKGRVSRAGSLIPQVIPSDIDQGKPERRKSMSPTFESEQSNEGSKIISDEGEIMSDENNLTEDQHSQSEHIPGSDESDVPYDENFVEPSSAETGIDIGPSSVNAEEPQLVCPVEDTNLPPNERQGLLKSLASFWADRTATGWRPLEYPLNHSDHMFADSDVIVREDEPSSLIAFCLSYPDYKEKLRNLRKQEQAIIDPESNQEPSEMERHMLKNTGTHLKYQFQERSAKLSCKIFYAEQFDAIRRQCDCDESFIQSLSRCVKWDSSGGKSGSAFLKTLDDRFVVKQLSQSELDTFVKFAPSYFEFMAQAFFHELPTALAKIFGFYQIQMRNPITHKNFKMDVLVMENLFYNRKTSRIFDLKGSMRNRHVKQTGRENEVLLDENMVEFIYESPLFVRNHSKTSLRLSLFNDTLFLAKMNVMDYSLVIAIDDERQELIVGIIDFIRTFTWDKKLESWVKERGLVGGGVKEPTVVSPKQYKFRFREAMERYVMMVPDCWYPVYNEEHKNEDSATN